MSGRAGGACTRAVALAACLLAASCGGAGDGGGTATATTVASIPAGRWSTTFCTAYATWTMALDDAGATAAAAFALPDRAANKAALAVLFRTSADATGELVVALDAAGVPDVDGGPALVQDLVGRFEAHQAALTAIAGSADDLTTDPPDEFVRQVTALRATYQEDRAQVGTAFTALGDTEAGRALADEVGADCGRPAA